MINMWGLTNCDSCRRARHWLEARGIQFTFHDLHANIPEATRLSRWLKTVGIEVRVNRRSTTWRKLPAAIKQQLETGNTVAVLKDYPALLKRPIIEHDQQLLVGFDATHYKTLTGGTQ